MKTRKELLLIAAVIVNAIILLVMCGVILYTLTYTKVPLSAQHEWFGTDLHKYLVFEHAGITAMGLISMIIVTVTIFVRGGVKEEDKKDENDNK